MDKYIDINFWINTQDLKITGNEGIGKISKLLNDNNIASSIVTNKVSLVYDWNTGNNEPISLSGLMENENIYFSYIIVPEAYFLFDFEEYIKSCISNKMRIIRIFPRSHLFHLNNH